MAATPSPNKQFWTLTTKYGLELIGNGKDGRKQVNNAFYFYKKDNARLILIETGHIIKAPVFITAVY